MDEQDFRSLWQVEIDQDDCVGHTIERLTRMGDEDQIAMQTWMRHLMDEIVHSKIVEVQESGQSAMVDIGDIFFSIIAPSIVLVTAAYIRDTKPPGDHTSMYLTAVMAENKVREYKSQDVDLGVIYPVDVVKDVTSGLDPVESFMVGVVAGGQR